MAYHARGSHTNASAAVQYGRLLYIINPHDHIYELPEEVPNYFAEAIPYVAITVFLELIFGFVNSEYEYKLFYVFNNVSGAVMQLLFHKAIFTPFMFGVYCYVYDKYRLTTLPWDSMWTWYLTFLLVDFTYYWFHRSAHEVNFLWASHQMHHSSEDFNLTTALRQSIVQKYFKGFLYLPMALLLPPSIHLIHNQFNLLYQFWIHTEVVGKLGPLEYILNTASHHRVHHGRNPYCIDKNYGGTLIIWDRLFGTFAEEDKKVAYGLVHENTSANPLVLQFGYYYTVFWRSMKMKNLSDKINVWLKGPGWLADCEKEGLTPEQMQLPEMKFWLDFIMFPTATIITYSLFTKVEQPIRKRDLEQFKMENRFETHYVFFHLLITLVVFQEIFARRLSSLSVVAVYGCITYIFSTLTFCGLALENRWFWKHLEAVRCFFVILADVYLAMNSIKNPLLPDVLIYAVRAIHVVSLLLTCFHILFPQEPEQRKQKKNK